MRRPLHSGDKGTGVERFTSKGGSAQFLGRLPLERVVKQRLVQSGDKTSIKARASIHVLYLVAFLPPRNHSRDISMPLACLLGQQQELSFQRHYPHATNAQCPGFLWSGFHVYLAETPCQRIHRHILNPRECAD